MKTGPRCSVRPEPSADAVLAVVPRKQLLAVIMNHAFLEALTAPEEFFNCLFRTATVMQLQVKPRHEAKPGMLMV
jgi:hypothetical protein